MSPFDLEVLIWPATAIFCFTLVVSLLFIKEPASSILAAFLKAGIFFVYFGYLFDGTYTFLDDWSYLNGGHELISKGVGTTNLADNWEFALMIGGGDHFVYYLYNAYAITFFGDGYFAPVALNILLTVAIAYYGARLAIVEFGMSRRLSKWFYLFLLLHPDILAWSSIVNGKDILVLLLHVLLITAISFYFRGKINRSILLGSFVVLILFFLRFYVPILFAMALVGVIFLAQRRERSRYLLFSFIFLVTAVFLIGGDQLKISIDLIREHFVNPVYGFIRMLLTPIPFNAETNYAFLDFPALIHWILLPFVMFGILRVWRLKTPFSRFVIAYFLVFLSLYAVFGELQGPRHRVQLDFTWAIFQFLGIMAVFRARRLWNAPPRESVAV